MNDRTLLVDGTNMFIINFTANPSLSEDGVPIGGISGTLKYLNFIIRTIKPGRVIFIWDGPKGSVQKRKLFNEYKKGRRPRVVVGRNYAFPTVEAAVENKIWQTEQLRHLLGYLPIQQIVTESIEADDAIGYITNHHEYFDMKSCIIATCDQDFYQLINDSVVVFNPMKKKLFTTESLIEAYGFHPQNWLFYKAINGDVSDNIDGVKGIGPKTIQKLFDVSNPEKKYTVDSIVEQFEDLESVKSKTHKKWISTLHEKREILARNWRLMSLKDAMIPMSVKDRLTTLIKGYEAEYDFMKFFIEAEKIGNLNLGVSFRKEFRALTKGIKNK